MEREQIGKLSDEELLRRVEVLNSEEHSATVALVLHLIEVEDRRLYLGLGYSTLFNYCRERLGYSEPGAYRRITAARAIRDFAELHPMLVRKEISLTTLSLFASILTDANKGEILPKVRHASRSEVEAIVAGYREPKTVIDKIAPLGRLKAAELPLISSAAPAVKSAETVKPEQPTVSAETRYKIQFSANGEFMQRLYRIMELRGERELESVLGAAMDLYLNQRDPKRRLERRAKRQEQEPASKSDNPRAIPVALRDTTLARDGHRCSFVGMDGVRCTNTTKLQIDHKIPVALGGSAAPENLRALCAAHNLHVADQIFGREFMLKFHQ